MTHEVVGRWAAEKNDRAFLAFLEDGTVRGSDGANAIATSWSEEAEGLMIAPSMTTLMAAPGMLTWVPKARRVEPDGNRLNLFDTADNHLGVLLRQPPGSADTNEGR
ncbi:META domain-containing protein [Brevibacterium renqingii]|uniref:META domain-containing protein n=1 Tax=Brevibacterium renqingii TaxID=2776916 RepID=UPI001ADF3AAE|nr:META domain-containing protein [Brevibacterium renqingii]